MKYTLSGRQQQTLMKLLVDAATDRVVGAHMVGDDAAEIIQGIGIADEGRRHQGAVRRHGRHPPDGGEEFVTMRTAARPRPRRREPRQELSRDIGGRAGWPLIHSA